jgi:pyridoxal phosphate enzyme (YggS family)
MFDFNKYREIEKIIHKSGKKTEIIAISKNHTLEQVERAISHKVEVFGENRVQEALKKFENLKKNNKSIKLHLTGPLQTNKVKQALDIFDVFHTIDREKLIKEIAKYPEKITSKTFFIQVNTGKEESKSGVFPEKVGEFITLCNSYGIKNIIGLMCIPPINEDPKIHFNLINNLSADLGLNGLSIGMSSDYLEALDFDPIYIRLGTVLFGKRE